MVALADETTPEEQPKWAVAQVLSAFATAQQGRSVLWTPVAMSFGIWIYFALYREPVWWLAPVLGAVALALAIMARARGLLMFAAVMIAGFALAEAKALVIGAPVLHATTADRLVTATIADVIPAARGRRTLIVKIEQIEGFAASEAPRRLRLSATAKQGEAQIGWRIEAKAMLAPLPTPVLPGGFDYGRDLWWDGIGGTGRLTTPIVVLSRDVGWHYRLGAAIADVRRLINRRIDAVLTGTEAAIGEAIITGERSSIPRAVNLSFQVSGLAHVLSISGLHMALAAGGVFWMVRALLALIPVLALRFPIKKWAAATALVAGLFYMLLAGSGVATQRSYIMIAVVFFAVLVDRPAISVRNLALAAILILMFEPEAATQASFQMSFLAVMGLTAYYEYLGERRRNRNEDVRQARHWLVRKLAKFGRGFLAAVMTTLIAGSMSSIPAAYHFGRLAPYSLIANGLALPVISFIIMPMALVSVVAMPFGLEAWPLWAMGRGIALMMAISDGVAEIPGAYVVVAKQSEAGAIVMATGAAFLCLWRGPLRLAGLAAIAVGVMLGTDGKTPDILIERSGAAVAFRGPDGLLVPAPGRKGRFAIGKWLLASGDEASAADAAQRPGWTCVTGRCTARVAGKVILYLSGGEGSAPDCGGADIVIADFPLRGGCAGVALRIDRFDLWRNGAHGIRIVSGGFEVTTARGLAGDRPWVLVPEPRKDKYRKPAAG